MTRKFVNTCTHPLDGPNGEVIAPGEHLTLKEMTDHTQGQIDAGLLIEVDEPAPKDKGGKN